jgi:hypothetical protein
MSTNSIITIKKSNKIIASLYSKFDGHPFFLGRIIKKTLFGCVKMSDSDFNNVRYNNHINSLPEDKRPAPMDLDAIINIKYKKEPIFVNEIEIHAAIKNERTLSARLIAGLYNKYEEEDCPNTIEVNKRIELTDVTYHYVITLKKNIESNIVCPYIMATYGFEGKIIYEVFIDNWDINETED